MTRDSDAQLIDRLIARNIRQQRLWKQLSQTELGDAIGVTFQQIQKYETGANRTSAARLFHIAQALGVPVAALFDESRVTDECGHPDRKAPLSLKAERQAARLVKAFSRIASAKLRSRIAELIEEMVPGSG